MRNIVFFLGYKVLSFTYEFYVALHERRSALSPLNITYQQTQPLIVRPRSSVVNYLLDRSWLILSFRKCLLTVCKHFFFLNPNDRNIMNTVLCSSATSMMGAMDSKRGGRGFLLRLQSSRQSDSLSRRPSGLTHLPWVLGTTSENILSRARDKPEVVRRNDITYNCI